MRYISFYDQLLEKSGKTTNARDSPTLCVEICKTLNKFNLSFMKDIFRYVMSDNSQKFCHRIWNSLPDRMKLAENLITLKIIKVNWSKVLMRNLPK